jgi:hypothetical protein
LKTCVYERSGPGPLVLPDPWQERVVAQFVLMRGLTSVA